MQKRTSQVFIVMAALGALMAFYGCGEFGDETVPRLETIVQSLATQEGKLLASDGVSGDNFGYSVSISGNTALVGAYLDDDKALNAGTAFMFIRTGTVWSQQQKLTASDGAADDHFGRFGVIENDTAIIGANNNDSVASNSGSAYVFVRTGTVWSQQQKLTAFDGAASDVFGFGVSLSGNTALIGAWEDDGPGDVLTSSGSAYVFVRTGTVWSQQQKLTASDANSLDFFSYTAVSVSGDTALIGAYGDDDVATNAGSAYVFVRTGTVWSQQQKLTASDGGDSDRFGRTVSLSNNTAVIGAYYDTHSSFTNAGSAYVFVRTGTVWSQQQKLTASDPATSDYFAYSVSVSGDRALIGSYFDDDMGSNSGSAYLFSRTGTTWSQEQKLTAADGAATDYFGWSVSLSGDMAIMGAWQDDDKGSNSGSAYVFNGNSISPPALVLPAPGSTVSGSTVTFTWTPGNGNDEFWFYVGNSYGVGDLYNSESLGTSTSTTVINLPTDGRVLFLRLWYKQNGTWYSLIYSVFAYGFTAPSIVSPVVGSTLSGTSATFTWEGNGMAICNWWLYAGWEQGSNLLFDGGQLAGTTWSQLVTGLPSNGASFWVRLWYGCSGVWNYIDAQYESYNDPTGGTPALTSPVKGSTLSGTSVNATWTDNSWGSQMWWVYAGSTQGSSNYYDSGWLNSPATLNTTITGLPTNGSTVWIRLWYKKSDTAWLFKDYSVTAVGP